MSLDAMVYDPDALEPVLKHHCIGNITRVAYIREEFGMAIGVGPPLELIGSTGGLKIEDWLAFQYGLTAFTIRNGSHCMDSIPTERVPRLKRELLTIPRGGDRLEVFRAQMLELCDVAIRNKLPIKF